ncbi:MAG: hypothetical protein Fur0023_10700 [Bacteroidia bacterium]
MTIIYSHYEIDIPKYRSWFDFSFTEEGVFIPVNIKITETTRADNLNAKLGMYYALTGLLPDFPNEINWLNYFEILSDNMGKNKKRDYYFLVVNKNNTNDVFINSLKCLRKLVPNGNNIPFQCRWIDNKNPIQRNFSQSKRFLLSNFGKSIKLRAEIYFQFKKYFREYVI